MLSTASPNFGATKHQQIIDTGFALDNGAYADHTNKRPFQACKFMKLVDKLGAFADFVVIPDAIADKNQTIDLANIWIDKLQGLKLAFVVQDGMQESDINQFIPYIDCIFIGGTTDWKLQTMQYWCNVAHKSKRRVTLDE